jgi:hypothetical protein
MDLNEIDKIVERALEILTIVGILGGNLLIENIAEVAEQKPSKVRLYYWLYLIVDFALPCGILYFTRNSTGFIHVTLQLIVLLLITIGLSGGWLAWKVYKSLKKIKEEEEKEKESH